MALLLKTASLAIMKDPLGLFFLFALLFMGGTSLECETCTAGTNSCSGERQKCLPIQDACISWVTESTAGNGTMLTTTKGCSTWLTCGSLKGGASGWSRKSRVVIKNIQCNKAPLSSGSFLLAPTSLLLLKLLL